MQFLKKHYKKIISALISFTLIFSIITLSTLPLSAKTLIYSPTQVTWTDVMDEYGNPLSFTSEFYTGTAYPNGLTLNIVGDGSTPYKRYISAYLDVPIQYTVGSVLTVDATVLVFPDEYNPSFIFNIYEQVPIVSSQSVWWENVEYIQVKFHGEYEITASNKDQFHVFFTFYNPDSNLLFPYVVLTEFNVYDNTQDISYQIGGDYSYNSIILTPNPPDINSDYDDYNYESNKSKFSLTGAFKPIGDFFKDLFGFITRPLERLAKWFSDTRFAKWFVGIGDTIWGKFKTSISAIENAITDVKDKIVDIWDKITNPIQDSWILQLLDLKSFIEDKINGYFATTYSLRGGSEETAEPEELFPYSNDEYKVDREYYNQLFENLQNWSEE